MEMVRTREDMLLVEECEEEEGSEGEKKEEEEEEGWCPLARLEEHNLEWVIQVSFISYEKRASMKRQMFQRIILLLDLVSLHVARQVCKR